MIISHAHKFIFLTPTRTATTTLWHVFRDSFGAELFRQPEWDWKPERYVTQTGLAQHQMVLPEQFADYTLILSVRNPMTRYLSNFGKFGHRHGKQAAADWFDFAPPSIVEELAVPRPGCIPITPDMINHVLHVESLDDDFAALPFVPEKIILPRENEGKTLTPRPLETLTKGIGDFVAEKYAADFAAFGYSMEITDAAKPPAKR